MSNAQLKSYFKKQIEEYYFNLLRVTFPTWDLFYSLLGVSGGLEGAQSLAGELYNAKQLLLLQVEGLDFAEFQEAIDLNLDDSVLLEILGETFTLPTEREEQAVLTAARNTFII